MIRVAAFLLIAVSCSEPAQDRCRYLEPQYADCDTDENCPFGTFCHHFSSQFTVDGVDAACTQNCIGSGSGDCVQDSGGAVECVNDGSDVCLPSETIINGCVP